MYLKFTTLAECENCIAEIDKRKGLNGNITQTYAMPREDINGAYVIPSPNPNVMNKIEKLVRPVTTMQEDLEGNTVEVDGIEIVKKQFNELNEDITVYDGTEYVLTQQTDMSDTFTYVEVETVEMPIIENEEV